MLLALTNCRAVSDRGVTLANPHSIDLPGGETDRGKTDWIAAAEVACFLLNDS